MLADVHTAFLNKQWDRVYEYMVKDPDPKFIRQIFATYTIAEFRRNPLEFVVYHGAPFPLIELIWNTVSYGDINQETRCSRSVLFNCRTPEVFEFLVKHGADVNLLNSRRETVMMHFACYNRRDIDYERYRGLLVACLKHGVDHSVRSYGLGYQNVWEILDCCSRYSPISCPDPDVRHRREYGMVYHLLKNILVLIGLVQGRLLPRVGSKSTIRMLPIELVQKLKGFLYV